MKQIAFILILSLAACVDGPDTNAAVVAPDAGTDDFLDPKGRGCSSFQRLVAPDAGVDEGRKGGETVRCGGNCSD